MKNLRTYNDVHVRKIIKKISLVTIGVVVLSVSVQRLAPKKTSDQELKEGYKKVYTSVQVENGDTLSSIAKEEINYDVYDSLTDYIDEIKEINDLPNDTIIEGQYLSIPRIVEEKEEDLVVFSYLVEAGDSLGSIASEFGDSVSAICERNDISKDAILNVGTSLHVESTKDKSEYYRLYRYKERPNDIVLMTYYVEEGDTLSSIALEFEDSVPSICERNGISKHDTLNIGTPISIETKRVMKEIYEDSLMKRENDSSKRI